MRAVGLQRLPSPDPAHLLLAARESTKGAGVFSLPRPSCGVTPASAHDLPGALTRCHEKRRRPWHLEIIEDTNILTIRGNSGSSKQSAEFCFTLFSRISSLALNALEQKMNSQRRHVPNIYPREMMVCAFPKLHRVIIIINPSI